MPSRFGRVPDVAAIYPFALIVAQGAAGDAKTAAFGVFGRVIPTSLFQSALRHTIEIAVASSLGCLILGLALPRLMPFEAAYNNTPRKSLGFKSPAEVFLSQLLHFECESTSRLSAG